jgi:hypothetical protein
MDREYIDRYLLIDRYLQGALSNGEEAAFEERLAWDQDLIDEVDLAERLREGLQAAVADDQFTSNTGNFGIVSRLTGLFAVPRYAAAASFLLAVILTSGVLLNPFTQDDIEPGGPVAVTEIVPIFAVRSDVGQTVAVNRDAWTVLLVDVVGSYDSYRVTVREDIPGAKPFLIQDGLLPTYPDALAVGMPGAALAGGPYVLSLEALQESGAGDKTYEHIQDIQFQTTIVE